MPQETYNPIQGPFDTRPARKQGTVVIELRDGEAQKVTSTSSTRTPLIDWSQYVQPRVLATGILLFLILIWLIGFAGILLGLIVTIAAMFFLATNRNSLPAQLLLGHAPEFFLVDIAEHTVRDERRAQLKQNGVYAIVEFTYRAKVSDPEKIVEEGIEDIRDHLSHKFYSHIDKCASSASVDAIDQLREMVASTLTPHGTQAIRDDLIGIISILVDDLRVEGKLGEKIAALSEEALELQALAAQSRIDDAERNKWLSVIADDNQLVAEMMRVEDNSRLQQLITMRLDQRGIDFEQNVRLFEMMLKNDLIEAHQIQRDHPDFYEQLMSRVMPGMVGSQREQPKKLEAEKSQERNTETEK